MAFKGVACEKFISKKFLLCFMSSIEITKMSSKGQVVIPQHVREELGLKEGEAFAVLGKDDTVVLTKIEVPSFKEFDTLLKRTKEFAKRRGIKPDDVDEAIRRTRSK